MSLAAAVDMATNNTNWQTEDRGDMEKLLAMLVLGFGSLFSGMLPAIISAHNRLRFPLITSLLLCYGAGILLATALVHILPEVLFLLGAVACHKFVMGFCLGLELCSYPRASFRSHFIGILVFALGAVCGIGVGMLIVDIPAAWSKTTLPIIQALAGGTLFYVTVCEVIPREKARWHTNSTRRWAGFAQFATVIAGFATMCIINFYLADD
ncbi:zinc transporter ZIP2 isoform X2 [Drosophila virilis]|uniref:zinc transporter ZIP2 isoform X2 n=1 Tax=Drosophila virilis TaxID=7244 RepID=UPI0038B2FF92